MKTSAFIVLVCLLTCCTKYREVPPKKHPIIVPPDSLGYGSLRINEFTAKGYPDTNEFNVPSKWFEIYNPSSKPITLDTSFFFTDTLGYMKFQIPFRSTWPVIQPGGFYVLWCDNMDTIANAKEIHTNFSISSNGESLGIYHRDPQGKIIVIDSTSFGPYSNKGISVGLFPDGQGIYLERGSRTPMHPNVP